MTMKYFNTNGQGDKMSIITQQLQPKHWIRLGVLLFLLASLLPVLLFGPTSPVRGQVAAGTQNPAEPPVTQHGAEAIAQLKQQGSYDSLAAAMRQARYSVSRASSTPLGRAAWHAPNPANGYDGYVTEDGVSISLGGAVNKAAYVSLTLRGIGYGYGLQYVGGGEVSGDQQAIRIERDGQFKALKEWYVNSESGLEQGFT
ncbi:MAG: hypothetical protein M3X11_20805, partial [Acidobacteriota bacterium]|nr:hypothetical protein [Acidobacteriota bacterium]